MLSEDEKVRNLFPETIQALDNVVLMAKRELLKFTPSQGVSNFCSTIADCILRQRTELRQCRGWWTRQRRNLSGQYKQYLQYVTRHSLRIHDNETRIRTRTCTHACTHPTQPVGVRKDEQQDSSKLSRLWSNVWPKALSFVILVA